MSKAPQNDITNYPSASGMRTAPLSAAQRRLWYMAQLDPSNPFYNVTIAMRLRFAVDVEGLRRALGTLVRRHEILRTRYPVEGGVPVQEIMGPENWSLTHVERRWGDTTARDLAVARFARKVARMPLALDASPPFRLWLFSAFDDDHLLVLVTHHIAIDQRSINLLTSELEQLYEAPNENHGANLSEPVQYREFAQWEAEQLRIREPELRAYWDRQLEVKPCQLPLPYDRPQKEQSKHLAGEYRFQLSDASTTRLRALCRRGRATEFMGLFAVWAALLHRYTRETTIFIGTTTAFRGHRKFSASVGCFINTHAVRFKVDAERTFEELLAQARDQLLDAFEHAGFSYERLIERMRVLWPGTAGDFVNAYLQFQPRALAPPSAVRRFTPNINVHNGRAKFSLMLNVSDRSDTFECALKYDQDRFVSGTIRTIARDLLSIIEVVSAAPHTRIGAIPLGLSARCESNTVVNETPYLAAHIDNGAPSRPLSTTEAVLASLWLDLLLKKPTGPDDDFFVLGGHSLLVAQLAWKIRESMGVEVRVRDLQRAGPLEEMARLVDAAPPARSGTGPRPATQATLIDGLPCQIELGTWVREDIEKLIAELAEVSVSGPGDRVARAAWAFRGTPFQFESRRPLPPRGQIAVRFGAFDCITFVYTALALGLSQNFAEFVHTLRTLRYRDPERLLVDSDPKSGTIFDFVEESLIVNAVRRGLLVDVTANIAGGVSLETIETRVLPRRRDATLDPLELWATPKLGTAPIPVSFLPRTAFDHLDSERGLRSGDVIIMGRGCGEAGQVVDHVGFAYVDSSGSYLLQSTRHFAWRPNAIASTPGDYTGIFYDSDRRCEQIGVGIAGSFVGDEVTLALDGINYYGYEAGDRRPLVDYLEGAGFKQILILRPV